MREPSPGDVLAAKYRLVSILGRGGMGSVWRADHLVLNTPVALKLVRSDVLDQPDASARFLREAQAAAALRSAHVVQILDFGVDQSIPFIVMELLEGESLRQRLKRVGRLSFEETVRVVTHVTRALTRAHERGIVHRDLKPDNVFIVPEVGEEQVKVLDFGVAKLVSESGVAALTNTGTAIGSPHYMSPEQARGTRSVDFRTDLWALGVIVFECVTGRRPFESEVFGDLLLRICTDPVPMPSSFASVPPGFDEWCQRALARAPEDRFGSAEELAQSLRALASGVPSHSLAPLSALPAPPSPTVPIGPAHTTPSMAPVFSSPPPRSGQGLAMLVALGGFAIAVVIALGVVLVVVQMNQTPEATSARALPSSSTPVVSGVPLLDDPVAAGSGKPSSTRAGTKPETPKATAATGTTPPATTPTGEKTSNACAVACAKLQGCGLTKPCNPAVCAGQYKTLADCINSKKSCADILSCQ